MLLSLADWVSRERLQKVTGGKNLVWVRIPWRAYNSRFWAPLWASAWVWSGTWESVCLTSSQVMGILFISGPVDHSSRRTELKQAINRRLPCSKLLPRHPTSYIPNTWCLISQINCIWRLQGKDFDEGEFWPEDHLSSWGLYAALPSDILEVIQGGQS